MPNTDGSLIIGVDLSLTQAEKQLKKFEGKVEETEKKIKDITAKRDQAKQDGVFQAGVLDAEKAKLEEIKSRLREAREIAADKGTDKATRQEAKAIIPDIQAELSEQQERVRGLQAEWNKTEDAVTRYDNQLMNAQMELDQNKAKAGELADAIKQTNQPTERFKRHLQDAGKDVDKLGNRLKRLMSRVMVFSVFTLALRSMRTWMLNVIKTNDQATQAIAKLKGALLTMVQPLVNVIIPAFITLVQVLTKVISSIATLISALFGTTAEESAKAAENLQSEQDALNGVGKAAKKAGNQLASFDEINKLQDQATDTSIAPNFEVEFPGIDQANKFLNAIKLIAAALLALKFSDVFLDGLTKFAGFAIAIQGISLALQGLKDAWDNGVDWDNMAQIIGGVALAATGLYIAFGKIGAGIALVVGGIVMLVTGFQDAMESGWNLQNTLLTIAGLFATGLGIFFITGSAIPALIGAIAGLLLAITVATGHGEELIEGIRTILEGFVEFFTGIFTGDLEMAIGGIEKIFDGLKETVGAVLDGIKDFFLNFFDWLDEKTGGRFHGIIEFAKGIVTAFFDEVSAGLSGFIDGVKIAFEGLIKFFTGVFTMDFDLAWEGVKDVFKGAWDQMASILETVVNLIIDGINWLLSKLNNISFDVPDWVPFIGGKTWGFSFEPIQKFKLPHLAQGAVIPPNREFAAVLGDQTHGNNLEAPEDLIRQIVREESGGNYTGILQQILAAIKEGKVIAVDRREFGRIINQLNSEESKRVGVSFVGVRT